MSEFRPSTSDDTIRQATGRDWDGWFQLLNDSRMESRTRAEIVTFLENEHSVSSWWRQMITSNYEQKIGRRAKHEKPDGFEISVTRTLDFPVGKIYEAWADDEERARWMRKSDFNPTTRKPPGTVRGRWLPNDSRIDVEMSEVGEGRCQLRVMHRKLPNEEAALRMKDLWPITIDRMVTKLQAGN